MQREDFFKSGVFQVVKGVGVALVLSVLLAVIYALILRVLPMGNLAVTIVSQVLKGLALGVAVAISLRGEKGLIKGCIVGVLFCALGHTTFSMLGGGFALSWLILLEFVVFFIVGGLTGALIVNLKRG